MACRAAVVVDHLRGARSLFLNDAFTLERRGALSFGDVGPHLGFTLVP